MFNQIKFGKDEIRDIIASILALSVAFTIFFAGGLSGIETMANNPDEFIVMTFLCIVTVGSGFILHEMAHKITAIYYGASAKFVMWFQGIFLMMLTSLFGFIFAAPGAVYIYAPRITRKENGMISLAGPVTNLVVAIAFIFLSATKEITVFLAILGGPISVWQFGAYINLLLGLFNAIPVFPLDGSKIFAWSKVVWGGFLIATGIVAIVMEKMLDMPGFFMGMVVSWGILLVLFMLISGLFSRVRK
ncbi:MAG: site-2 protease family protein [Candidatus Micrarchaeota archaeon]